MTVTPMPGKKPNVIINISHRIYVGMCQKKKAKVKTKRERKIWYKNRNQVQVK